MWSKQKYLILLKQVHKTAKDVFINISTDGKVYHSSRPNKETSDTMVYVLAG